MQSSKTICVTKMTNYLSNSPTFTYVSASHAISECAAGRSAGRVHHDLPEHDDPCPQHFVPLHNASGLTALLHRRNSVGSFSVQLSSLGKISDKFQSLYS
jgi:hypothetical protein